MKSITLLISMLIAVSGYSMNGPDSCQIVLIEQDTFALVPIQLIKVANSIKVMNDGQKQVIEHLQGEVKDLRLATDVCHKQNRGFKAIIENRNKLVSGLQTDNDKLIKANKSLKRRVIFYQSVAIITAISAIAIVLF